MSHSIPLTKRNTLVEVKLGTKDSHDIQKTLVGVSFCNIGDRQRQRICSFHGLPLATCELLKKEISNKRTQHILNGFSAQNLVTAAEMECFKSTDLSSYAEIEMAKNMNEGNIGNEDGKRYCDDVFFIFIYLFF